VSPIPNPLLFLRVDWASWKSLTKGVFPKKLLEQGRIEPRLHYRTVEQAALWQRVFQKHAPLAKGPVEALYQNVAATVGQGCGGASLTLVSIGVGTGKKDHQILRALLKAKAEVAWVPSDISLFLLLEAATKAPKGLQSLSPVLGDFQWAWKWSEEVRKSLPRQKLLYTVFGLLPNFEPEDFFSLLRRLLRRGAKALVSVPLAPGRPSTRTDYRKAVEQVIPQYDNLETKLWLTEVLRDWGIAEAITDFRVGLTQKDSFYGVVATVLWKKVPRPVWCTSSIRVTPGKTLELFRSYRYTVNLFEETARSFGLFPERSWVSADGQEGVWELKRSG
jgi:L-histidine N-alpha-methyltransferase